MTKEERSTRDELLLIVQTIAGRKGDLPNSTRIYQDLEIAGDDAAELLERVRMKFGTKFDGFDFSAYFPDETEAFLDHLLRLLGIRRESYKEIQIGHLVAVIQRGSWFEPS
jgi:hypothetical protein